MSDFLAEYRTKFPEYNDLPDDQLASALNQKYNAETGANLPIEEFHVAIGFQQTPPEAEAVPVERSMLSLVDEKLTNTFGPDSSIEPKTLDADTMGAPEDSAYRRFMGNDVPNIVKSSDFDS